MRDVQHTNNKNVQQIRQTITDVNFRDIREVQNCHVPYFNVSHVPYIRDELNELKTERRIGDVKIRMNRPSL